MARSRSRESFSGKRGYDRRYLKARPLPPMPELEDFLLPTPNHHVIVVSRTGKSVSRVLCDCPATSDHH